MRRALAESAPNPGGTTQNYTYDAADRLTGSGIVYDDYGRITSLPAVLAVHVPFSATASRSAIAFTLIDWGPSAAP